MDYHAQPLRIVQYPYRAFQPFQIHVAPLYAVWNAGPKLIEQDIPDVAVRFCEDGDDPQQSERIGEIQSRLELVAEIWRMIETAQPSAEAWGKTRRGKRRYPLELGDDSTCPSPSRTSAPSTRIIHSQISRNPRRSQKSPPTTPTTPSQKPAKSRKITSANDSKGKGKGRDEDRIGDLHDAGVEGEDSAPRSKKPVTQEALLLHNALLHVPSDGNMHPVQRWMAEVQYTPDDFLEREQMPSKLECTPTDEQPADAILTPVKQSPVEMQHTPIDILDQWPVERKPADIGYTPSGTVDQSPAEGQHTSANVVNQRPAEVAPIDMAKMQSTNIKQTMPPTPTNQPWPAITRGRRRTAPEVASPSRSAKRPRSSSSPEQYSLYWGSCNTANNTYVCICR